MEARYTLYYENGARNTIGNRLKATDGENAEDAVNEAIAYGTKIMQSPFAPIRVNVEVFDETGESLEQIVITH
jgi:hypothetical protein